MLLTLEVKTQGLDCMSDVDLLMQQLHEYDRSPGNYGTISTGNNTKLESEFETLQHHTSPT